MKPITIKDYADIVAENAKLEAKVKERADEIKILRRIRDQAYGVISTLKDKQDD